MGAADALRAKFKELGALSDEIQQLYESLPVESLDSEDDMDLVDDISWLRWSRTCDLRAYDNVVNAVLADPQWS